MHTCITLFLANTGKTLQLLGRVELLGCSRNILSKVTSA